MVETKNFKSGTYLILCGSWNAAAQRPEYVHQQGRTRLGQAIQALSRAARAPDERMCPKDRRASSYPSGATMALWNVWRDVPSSRSDRPQMLKLIHLGLFTCCYCTLLYESLEHLHAVSSSAILVLTVENRLIYCAQLCLRPHSQAPANITVSYKHLLHEHGALTEGVLRCRLATGGTRRWNCATVIASEDSDGVA